MRKNPWRRIAVTVSAMLVVLLLASSYRFVVSRGYFAAVEDKTPGSCQTVQEIGGVQAISVDAQGRAYIAAGNGLYLAMDGFIARLSGTPKDFYPTAIGLAPQSPMQVLFRQHDGWKLSYFDHRWEIESKKYDRKSTTLIFDKRITPKVEEASRMSADTLTDPADLVSIDGTRFYLVNKHGSHTALGRWLDDAFLIPRASVLYFDGMKFITVAERLNATAAVALSPDGGHLYVAEELPRTLASFSRNVFTGALDNAELINLPAAPTKITLAPDGSLIVAAWPKRGAGAVYRVRLTAGVPQPAELLYSIKSEEITAAAETNGHLLIGSGKRLIDCKI